MEGTASLTVNAPVNVTVSVTKDDKTFTRSSGASGVVRFGGLSTGTWKVKIDDGRGQTREKDVMIVADYNVTIAFFEVSVTVNYPAGSTVIAQNDGETLNAPDTSGLWEAKLNKPGNWTFTATKGKDTDTKTINITEESRDIVVKLSFEAIPVFTYTGNYEIVDDNDSPITTSKDNWKIRFLTSGEFTVTKLNSWNGQLDVFLVGGGGGGASPSRAHSGGGGGGYTTTGKNIMVSVGSPYAISIGSGGAINGDGGNTSAFNLTANGGRHGNSGDGDGGSAAGGNGGSGGGGGSYGAPANGGSDGSDGGAGTAGSGGVGQHTTTREFSETSGKPYSGGGGGGNYAAANGYDGTGGTGGAIGGGNGSSKSKGLNATAGENNTGGGGGGGSYSMQAAKGGSGIVIIRNHRV